MSLETHIAKRKHHRCDECGRRIPIGARYFYDSDTKLREHANCLSYQDQPALDATYNAKGNPARRRPA